MEFIHFSLYLSPFSLLDTKDASKYAVAPKIRIVLNPDVTASIMVITGERTENRAFVAHAHGMSKGFFSPINLIPIGNGMPIRRPDGIMLRDMMNALMTTG
ncbi:MAG: hypothetical protein Fur0020_01130 [Thermodesulfovibrionia bacterium]